MNYQRWTEEEDFKVKNNKKPNESWGDFAKREMPYRSADSVRIRSLRYLNVRNDNYRKRTYFFNKDAWKELTPESCYWGGFACADSCLVKYGGSKGYTFATDLQESDVDHLKKLSKFCGFTGDIGKARKRKSPTSDKICFTRNLRINCGMEWIDDLKKHFNIVPRKTKILQPPNIEDEYLKHCFMIGYIDGDGCLCFSSRENGKYNLSISITCASLEMAHWLQDELSNLTVSCSIRNKKRKLTNCSGFPRAFLNGNPACAAIDYFRQFPLPYLHRKWNNPEILSYIKTQKQKYPDKFIEYTQNI